LHRAHHAHSRLRCPWHDGRPGQVGQIESQVWLEVATLDRPSWHSGLECQVHLAPLLPQKEEVGQWQRRFNPAVTQAAVLIEDGRISFIELKFLNAPHLSPLPQERKIYIFFSSKGEDRDEDAVGINRLT